MAAANLHELMRCWENYHRILSVEAHARHILFREETRYPGYYYRGDFDMIDDDNWKCFTNSVYDAENQHLDHEEGRIQADVRLACTVPGGGPHRPSPGFFSPLRQHP